MVFRCPRGTKKRFRRVVQTRMEKRKGVQRRLGGCAKKGRFVKVKEVKKVKRKRTIKR